MRHAAWLLLLFAGCSVAHPIESTKIPDRITRIVWTKDFTPDDVNGWEQRLIERWPDRQLAIIYCHGGYDEFAERWNLYPENKPVMSVESAAQIIHALLPDRLVVILACNAHHERLKEPDTAYGMDYVWLKPGLAHRFMLATFEFETGVGSAWGLTINR